MAETFHRMLDSSEQGKDEIDSLISHHIFFQGLPEQLRANIKGNLAVEEVETNNKSLCKTLLYRQASLITKNPKLYVIVHGQVHLHSTKGPEDDGSRSPQIGRIASRTESVSPDRKPKKTLKSTVKTISVINAAWGARHPAEGSKSTLPDVGSLARSKTVLKPRTYEDLSDSAIAKLGDSIVHLKAGDCFGEEVLTDKATERQYSAVADSGAILLTIEDSGALQSLRAFLIGEVSPTFLLRPQWCRESLRGHSRDIVSDRVRIAHVLDRLQIIDYSKHNGNTQYLIDSLEYQLVGPHEVLAHEEYRLNSVHILMTGRVELRKKGARFPNIPGAENEPHALGDVVGVAECLGDILALPAPWFHGRHDCSLLSLTVCEIISFPIEVFNRLLCCGGFRCRSSNFEALLHKQNRSQFDNMRLASFMICFGALSQFPITSHIELAGKIRSIEVSPGQMVSSPSDPKGVRIVFGGQLMRTASEDNSLGEVGRTPSSYRTNLADLVMQHDLHKQSMVLNYLHQESAEETFDTSSRFYFFQEIEAYFSCIEQEILMEGNSTSHTEFVSTGATFGHSDVITIGTYLGELVAASRAILGLMLDDDMSKVELIRRSPFGYSFFERMRQAANVRPSERHSEELQRLLPALSDSSFSRLPLAVLEEMCHNLELLSVPPETDVCVEGAEAKCLYFVLKGSLAAIKGPEMFTLALYGHGTTFGHACLLPSKTYSYSVRTRDSVDMIVIQYERVQEYLSLASPDVYVELLECKQALTVPFELRVDEDEIRLEKALASLPNMSGKQPKILFEMCRRLRYKHVEAGEIICLEGDNALANYIIMSGSVVRFSGLHGMVRKRLKLFSGQTHDPESAKRRFESQGVLCCQGNLLRVKNGPYSEQWSAAKAYRIDEAGNFGIVTVNDSAATHFQHIGNLRHDLLSCEMSQAEPAALPPLQAHSPEKQHNRKTSAKMSAPSTADSTGSKKGHTSVPPSSSSASVNGSRRNRRRGSVENDSPAQGAIAGLDEPSQADMMKECSFSLVLLSGKVLDFQAPNEKEHSVWINCITYHVLKGLKDPLGHQVHEFSVGNELQVVHPPIHATQPHQGKTKQSTCMHSLVAKCPTDLMLIYNTDMDIAEKEYLESVRQEAMKLLRCFDLSLFPSEVLKHLAMHMKPKVIGKGDEIFRAGEKCAELIFLAEGECAIRMRSNEKLVHMSQKDGKEKHGSRHVCTFRDPSMLVIHTSIPLATHHKSDDVFHTVSAIALTKVRIFVLRLEEFRRIEDEHRLPLLEKFMSKLDPISRAQTAQLAQFSRSISQAFVKTDLSGLLQSKGDARDRPQRLDPNIVFFGESGLKALNLSLGSHLRARLGASPPPGPGPNRPAGALFVPRQRPQLGGERLSVEDESPRSAADTGPAAAGTPALSESWEHQGTRTPEPSRSRSSLALATLRPPSKNENRFLPAVGFGPEVKMHGLHRLPRPRDVLRVSPRRVFKRTRDGPLWGRCALSRGERPMPPTFTTALHVRDYLDPSGLALHATDDSYDSDGGAY